MRYSIPLGSLKAWICQGKLENFKEDAQITAT
jgi:hypothetical protein